MPRTEKPLNPPSPGVRGSYNSSEPPYLKLNGEVQVELDSQSISPERLEYHFDDGALVLHQLQGPDRQDMLAHELILRGNSKRVIFGAAVLRPFPFSDRDRLDLAQVKSIQTSAKTLSAPLKGFKRVRMGPQTFVVSVVVPQRK